MRPIRWTACLTAAITAPAMAAEEPNAFLNLSARGFVDQGERIIIGGLLVDNESNVLIRGIGPGLEPFGVEEPVAQPALTLFDSNGSGFATNQEWRAAIPAWSGLIEGSLVSQDYDVAEAPVAALARIMQRIGAFPLTNDNESMLYLRLAPGIYTTHLAGGGGAIGIGLLEIYLVPADVDPFPPAWRVRQSPESGYTPGRAGRAPIACVDETRGSRLVLQFDEPFTWTVDPSDLSGTATFASATIPWISSGTSDLRHGLAGVADSRGWTIAPRYEKAGPDTADVAVLVTLPGQAAALREELTLTFGGLRTGSFAYRWGYDDPETDQIEAILGESSGTFSWERPPPNNDGESTASPLKFFRRFPRAYLDGRPDAIWGMRSADVGPVLLHGDGPEQSDVNGAREAIVTEVGPQFVMHYDGCGSDGWRACRAVSNDLIHWEKAGHILELGPPGSDDAGCACSPWIIEAGGSWHMFYLGSASQTPAPDLVPESPYHTLKAIGASALGPWSKQPAVTPFVLKPDSYYAFSVSPGHVEVIDGEYLQYFTGGSATGSNPPFLRTLGLARTTDLDGAWTIDETPLVPPTEQIENSSLYFEPANGLWFLFTNHVGIAGAGWEYTDAIWVYWSEDPARFSADRRAQAFGPGDSTWAKSVIGMPSVLPVGDRLALFYDGNADGEYGHMRRDIGLAFFDLPLDPPPAPATP